MTKEIPPMPVWPDEPEVLKPLVLPSLRRYFYWIMSGDVCQSLKDELDRILNQASDDLEHDEPWERGRTYSNLIQALDELIELIEMLIKATDQSEELKKCLQRVLKEAKRQRDSAMNKLRSSFSG